MKKIVIPILIIVLAILCIPKCIYAESNITIKMDDSKITVNGETITSNETSAVYLTNQTNNGGTSSDAVGSNIEIDNVININDAGTYEFSGDLSNGQISINANSINGEVRIILNSVNINCKDAPAIFVYSKNPESENCKVIIETAEGTINSVTGGKIKQSVKGWKDQDSISYYIEKDYDEEGQYYERYKYDGAISSDISLTFEGKGLLNVTSNKKEGIESKMHITINEGTYNISSLDDAINASMDNKSIITINNGTIIANVLDEAEEGDGIDSNGYIYINGGTIYAFAHPGSDNGLDSDLGTYINGGTVIATGSMYEESKTTNNNKIIQMQFSKEVNADESIVIVDENENVIFAFKTDRKISNFLYTSSNLEDKTYSVYTGTSIEGELNEQNVYTNISSIDLNNMTKQENSGRKEIRMQEIYNKQEINELEPNTTIGKVTLAILILIVISLVVIGIVAVCRKNK